VRRTKVPFELPRSVRERAAVPKLQQGMAAGHELIVGEDDVALFAAEHEITAGQVEHIAGGPRGGELAQPAPGGLDRCAEQHHAVLDGRAQGLLDVGQELEAQDLFADQDQAAVRQFRRLGDASVDAVAGFERRDEMLAGAQADAGMAGARCGSSKWRSPSLRPMSTCSPGRGYDSPSLPSRRTATSRGPPGWLAATTEGRAATAAARAAEASALIGVVWPRRRPQAWQKLVPIGL
jgi:hypothetical protein